MIESFRTKRYRDTQLEDFVGEIGAYELYDDLLIPNQMIAIWDTQEGRFEYFRTHITKYQIH